VSIRENTYNADIVKKAMSGDLVGESFAMCQAQRAYSKTKSHKIAPA